MSSAVNGLGAASSSKVDNKPHILNLPAEALDSIFKHAQPRDLANLMLVSRSFHDVAAVHLYRQLNHVFADEDNKVGQLNVDHLAGILETLTTSDYNYAGHIKEISMDTLSTGESAEKASREFKYEYSCGKFLNTLLLGTLKKIRTLETFRWNVRVEISQSVFATLSKMQSLQHLHVRLQAGRSLHSSIAPIAAPALMPPPPNPVSLPPPHHHHHPHVHHHHHPPPPNPTGLGSYVPAPKCIQCNGDGRPPKRLGVHKPSRTPQNFSRFSGLKSLAILDMDTLEYIPEIAECISSSSPSLKHLKLSFSESLALKSRKKMLPDTSETETVQDDEEFDMDGIPPPPPPAVADTPPLFGNPPPGPSSHEADVRRERAAQEKALARIFSLEKETPDQRKLKQAAEQATTVADKQAQIEVLATARDDVDRLFITELQNILRELARKKQASGVPAKNVRSIETIEKAAAKYLERCFNAEVIKERKEALYNYHSANSLPPKQGSSAAGPSMHAKGGQDSQNTSPGPFDFDAFLNHSPGQSPLPGSGPSSNKGPLTTKQKLTMKDYMNDKSSFPQQAKAYNPTPVFSPGQATQTQPKQAIKSSASTSETGGETPEETPANTSFPKTNDRKIDDEVLDAVDMEHPDDDGEEIEDQEFLDSPSPSSPGNEIQIPDASILPEEPTLSNGTLEPELAPPSFEGKGKEPVREPINASENTKEQSAEFSGERAIQEYIRQNHGIALDSLSIYLIPVRASVLCRAVDVCALKHITLLNVGQQRAFWAMATKLHKTNPFQLTSVHTDNVTPSLLVFLNGLDQLTELFLHERSSRSKVEPFAPKTLNSIEDIRKQVLSKHMKQLKRLVIRNDDDPSWALNKDSVRLITKYGQNLKELGVSLGSTNFHLFMQNIGRLRSLVALQIIFTHNDNCGSVLREIRSCAIDNILHFPHLQIQYVAVGHVMHGTLTTIMAKLVKKSSRQQKGMSARSSISSMSTVSWNTKGKGKGKGKEVAAANTESPWTTPSDSDDDFEGFTEPSVRVIDNFKPLDATGIKMWEKEIWGLRL